MNERVAITTTSFGVADPLPLAMLRGAGYEPVLNEAGRALKHEETIALLADCVGVVAGTEVYDRDVLAALPGLRVISRVGVGVDAIDAKAAAELGIAVRNTPDGPTRAVAELTLALTLDLLRKVSVMDRDVRRGVWKKRTGNLLDGKRVGIVGFGRIGRVAAGLFEAFGCELAYCDVCEPDGDEPCARMDLGGLLAWADLVSVHCSASECPLIGAPELARMRDGSWLVNASRGSLVDEAALLEALESGKLAGAALDVYEREPYEGPLSSRDDVVLTPHVGSYAAESRIAMEVQAVSNLLEALS